MTRSTQQHTALAMRQLQATGAYAGQGFTATMKLDARGGRRFTVRTNGQTLRGIDAVWSCLDAEHRGIVDAQIRAEWEAASGLVELADDYDDMGPCEAAHEAASDGAHARATAARMTRAAAVAGGADPFNNPMRHARAAAAADRAAAWARAISSARATSFVRVSEDWAADAWAAAEHAELIEQALNRAAVRTLQHPCSMGRIRSELEG